MILKTVHKITSLSPWLLLIVGIFFSEILTLFFSTVFSFALWGSVLSEVIIIGSIDAFLVALIIVFFTIIIVKKIRITETTNKQLREEIEERKKTETKNIQLEKQLRQAIKMEAIGTLAGGIAHDFNNILSAILGYSEIAKAQLPVDDKIRQDLDQVLIAGHRAAELVRQILTFSRQGKEEFKPIKIQNILKEVLTLLRSSLPATITLEENINIECGMISADPIQIHQILMNICTNASHAIGEELGTLSVALAEIQITKDNNIDDCTEMLPGIYLDLKICDTGCGMDSLTKSKIFDPFFTTKEVGKGTGIGMAVVHGIVKQHRGNITVSSTLGEGSTFHVYLPLIDEQKTTSQQLAPEYIPQGKGERILFVDDEPALTNMMQLKLTDLGYNATTFSSSIGALDSYKKNPDNFDLVITDMRMPEMNGVELSRRLLAIRPHIPIILCTGFSETLDEAKAKSVGICDLLHKPLSQLNLAKAIRKALQAS